MKFSYNWLQSFFAKKLPLPEKLAELLTLHSFEVKEVQKKGRDFVLDIDVLPNRVPDCASHIGIARELSAILNLKFQPPSFQLKEDTKLHAKNFVTVEVKDKNACPRYSARVITNVKVGPSPQWLKERLESCGLQSINNIVDIVNYVMLETGQPLHAFDFGKIKSINPKSKALNPKPSTKAKLGAGLVPHRNEVSGAGQIQNLKSKIQSQLKTIIVRKAKKGEKITTLDDKTHNLGEDVLVIADERSPIAIAGIKGGKDPGIDKKTKIVVLESANFDSQTIRKGYKKLNLKTDASLRFEHGLDPNLTEFAINRTAFLIQEIAGGKITQGLIDFYPKKACPVAPLEKNSLTGSFGVLPKKIILDLDYVESLLGAQIPTKDIQNILQSLDFKTKILSTSIPQSIKEKKERKVLEVEIPTIRRDILLAEDLIEEIVRIWGFEKIPSTFPLTIFIPSKKNERVFWRNFARNILKELGFTETYNYSFLGEKDIELFTFSNEKAKADFYELLNPMSAQTCYLRPSLIPNLLKNVKENSRFPDREEIKVFEIGKIFRKTKGEKEMLTGLLFQKKEDKEGFYFLKGVIDSLLNQMGISNVWYDDYQPSPEESLSSWWHKRKCAEIKIDREEIGFLGEVSSRILSGYEISGKVFVFDLDFEKLSQLTCQEHEYRFHSPYPEAVRDLAILVPKNTRVAEVLNKIDLAGGNLVRDVDIFDIYEGEELPEEKKNFAFHIIYQAEDRTLLSKEIDEIHQKIIRALEENPEWEVRK